MFTLITAALAVASPFVCPVMGHAVNDSMEPVQVSGASFRFCCAGCDTKFAADPAPYVEKAIADDKMIGEFLFDPTTGMRIQPDAAEAFSDYKGVRYYFAAEASKSVFDAEPMKFTVTPAKEALFCPVMQHEIASYADASSYADHEGTRYYFCCGGCASSFDSNPASFVGNATDHVREAVALVKVEED